MAACLKTVTMGTGRMTAYERRPLLSVGIITVATASIGNRPAHDTARENPGLHQTREAGYRRVLVPVVRSWSLGTDASPVLEMSSAPAASKIFLARLVSSLFSEWTEISALPLRRRPSYRLASNSGMPIPIRAPVM